MDTGQFLNSSMYFKRGLGMRREYGEAEIGWGGVGGWKEKGG